MKWLPLPKIAHGIAIYPFSPSNLLQQQQKTQQRPSSTISSSGVLQSDDASIYTNTSSSSLLDQNSSISINSDDYSHLISLEVGDELFIIEQQGQWYRGYVLSTLEEGRKPNKAPIGCFPRSHVQIKEYIDITLDESDTTLIYPRRREISSESRPISDIPSGLPRSFSESYIQQQYTVNETGRPGSFGDLNFDFDSSSNKKVASSVLRIPPPPLPLARFDQSTITGNSEPLVDEIAACVSEWNSLLYTYINQRQYTTFNTVRDNINYLFQARRQLLDQALSREELVKLRKEIIHKMVTSNLDQNQQMIVRHPEKGYLLDATNASLSTIYRMHWKYATHTIHADGTSSTSSSSSLPNNNGSTTPTLMMDFEGTSTNSSTTTTTSNATATNLTNISTTSVPTIAPIQQQQQQQPKGAKFHHLFFELKACVAHICQPGELTELYFSLYSAIDRKFLTEQFVVILNYNGMPKDETQIGKLQTLFVDLSSHDMSDDLYIVCQVIRLGGMKFSDSNKDHFGSIGSHTSQFFHSNKHITPSYLNKPSTTHMCRRPFGCAVLKLNASVLQQHSADIEAVEHDMPIYTAVSESNFTELHENIIFNHTKDFTKHPRAEMLRVSMRTYFGYLESVLKTNAALLQDVPHTLRMGFADVAFPDDSRNDLYVKLEMGDLTQFSRSRNIQVTMCVRDNKTGEVIKNAISIGAGTRPISYWESMIMYHEQRPKWGETIKVHMEDVHQWERSHIYLTIKHRSSSFNGTGNASPMLKFNNSGPGAASSDYSPGSSTSVVSATSGGAEKIIAMGFLPLFLPPLHRDFVADGSHTLHLYKFDRQSSLPRYYLDNTPWCARSTAPSNTAQQGVDFFSKRNYRNNNNSGSRVSGHNYSPSTHSFKSFGSAATTTASSSANDIATLASSSLQQQQQSSPSKLVLLRDTITLSTFLCSNKFTQNKTLVKLLNWHTLMEGNEDGTAELLAVLDQFTFVGEVEVVKFLGDIFDALLDILAYPHDEDHDDHSELLCREINDQVLAAIIWLLGIVQDRRFSNFRPVLDVYIENRFSIQDYERNLYKKGEILNYSYRVAPDLTFEHLIKSLTRLCQNPGDASKAKILRSSMKVWDYLFRFIVRSRLTQQLKEDDEERLENDRAFKGDIEQLLQAITSIMSPSQPSSMIGTQTLALQHFADILVELHKIFLPQQVVEIAVMFVDACSHVTGRLVGFKLAMILHIVKGPTFDDPSCRLELAKNVFRWIRVWVNSYMVTAKDVIFARQSEQLESTTQQQIRVPRSQWIENLRLSLTIISEVLDRVRKSCGMTSSGLTSSCISSPSFSNYSRPTSFAAATNVEDDNQFNHDYSQTDIGMITEVALQLVPQLLNAYKDIQRLTMQAMHVPTSPSAAVDGYITSPGSILTHNSRPHSRQSFSILRERASSLGGGSKNPLMSPEILQEIQSLKNTSVVNVNASNGVANTSSGASISGVGSGSSGINISSNASLFNASGINSPGASSMHANSSGISTSNANSSASAFTVVLQALSTSPTTPFPSTYPFQPSTRTINTTPGLTSDYAAMISTGLLDLTVVFLELFYLTPRQQWIQFIKKMKEQDGVTQTADFLRKMVYTCMAILFGDSVHTLEESSLTVDGMAKCEEDESRERRKLPSIWLNLDTISHRIVMCHILEPIKTIFEMNAFIPTEKAYMSPNNNSMVVDDYADSIKGRQRSTSLPTMDEESSSTTSFKEPPTSNLAIDENKIIEEQKSTLLLWRIYFVGFLRVVGSPKLEISEFMPQVQRAVWKIIGNMRGEVGAKVFLSLWNLAGKHVPTHSRVGEYEDLNKSIQTLTDYFGSSSNSDFGTSHALNSNTHSPISVPDHHNSYFLAPDDSVRKSMASIEEVDDDDHEFDTNTIPTSAMSAYSVRSSVRIGPTDELPLTSIHEEHFSDEMHSEVSFLQADLAYFILSSVCAASLTLHDRVRINALSVIADIIAIELYSFGELCHVQHALISTLDRLVMSENKGDEAICARITVELDAALEQRLQIDHRTDLLITGKRAVDSLCRFLSLLLQIRSLPVDDDEFMDERITSTLKLMKFIQVIEREEIYIKYVHQLVQLHLDSRNFIEAALTLRFHADLLQWDPSDKLVDIPELSLPIQSSFSRKEGLYMKMITYLDQGSAWELCVDICKELAYQYETTLYDYTKLGEILQRQATFAENIVKKERCFTEYFRVGFYGRGFPASNRNRQYIYRGLEWEKMASFVERMQNRHPNAQLLPSKIANSISITDDQLKELNSTLDGQYLQITSVTPIPDTDEIPCLSNPNAPDSVKKYYSFNNVSKFSFSRPVTKEGASDKADESSKPESDFLNLWTEKVDFECEDKFPTIVRRSKIISSHASVISPIENAVTAMENKNKELISLEKKYSALIPKSTRHYTSMTQPLNINPFSMSLNGAVDAPVNGGVPLYKKAFLSKEYWEKNPDMRHWIQRLQTAIYDQVNIPKPN
jgi:hypothetical protein